MKNSIGVRTGRLILERTSLAKKSTGNHGNHENFFVVDGQRYSHILNPRTGLPVQGIAACTVIAPTCIESDAWATACFVLGVKKSLARLGERFAIRFTLIPSDKQEDWPTKQSRQFPPLR